jgi:hypothetical protein
LRCGCLCLVLGIAGGATAPVSADVYINQTTTSFRNTPNAIAFGSRYRLSQTNWDMMLGTSLNTTNPATFLQADFGNVSALTGDIMDFTLEHTTGGFIWVLGGQTQSWGTFSPTPAGQNAATLNGVAPGASFNTLKIEARGLNSGSNIGTMEFWDLSFTGTGLGTQVGSFDAGTATSTTSSPAYFGQTSPTGTYTQWLWSTDNLATKSWKLTGKIKGIKNYTTGNERVRFQISGLNAALTPEPGTLVLVSLPLLLLCRRKTS